MRNRTALFSSAALGVALMVSFGGAAQAQDTAVSWKGAPQFQNDTLTFKVRGRTYMDVVGQEVDFANPATTDLSTNTSRLRTARIGVEGTFNANWAYKAEFSITGGGTTAWEDLILEYKPNDNSSIMVGNFKSVSFENISSSRYIQMMERGPFNDVIDAGRVMTVQGKMNGENWTAAAFVHGDSVNNADPAVGTSEQFAYGARGTFAPINGDNAKLHLGAWARQRDAGQNAGGAIRYRNRNNTAVGDRYTDTGALYDVDTQWGLEALYIYKAFSVQGEYASIQAERVNSDVEDKVDAFYVSGSWFPTGEMRNLDVKKGELGRTKILNPMTAGGWGALELTARYDSVDMSDAHRVGPPATQPNAGEYSAVTVGANWYPHPYTRFMVNYTTAENDRPVITAGVNPDVDVKTLQFRAQFDF